MVRRSKRCYQLGGARSLVLVQVRYPYVIIKKKNYYESVKHTSIFLWFHNSVLIKYNVIMYCSRTLPLIHHGNTYRIKSVFKYLRFRRILKLGAKRKIRNNQKQSEKKSNSNIETSNKTLGNMLVYFIFLILVRILL